MKGENPSLRECELEELLCEHYNGLRRMARMRTRRLPPSRTLQTTGLVHEAYLRLHLRGRVMWRQRAYFLADMARAMRDIAVEYMRSKRAKKRGGHLLRTDDVSQLEDHGAAGGNHNLAIREPLKQLWAKHPRSAEIVFLRFYFGMTIAEIACLSGVARRTVERRWAFARRWLQDALAATIPS